MDSDTPRPGVEPGYPEGNKLACFVRVSYHDKNFSSYRVDKGVPYSQGLRRTVGPSGHKTSSKFYHCKKKKLF